MKIWKKINEYPTYEVSSDGELKTFNWKNKGVERIMRPARDGSGYLRTMLKHKNGKFCTIKVHRIVAANFIPNPENKPEVNHKNGIKTDNRVINLEWCTHSENLKHAFDTKLMTKVGEKNPAATVTELQVLEIRKNYVYGTNCRRKGSITKKDLAIKYNTTFNVIKHIIQGKTWKHLL
jgi:hypothetical protein